MKKITLEQLINALEAYNEKDGKVTLGWKDIDDVVLFLRELQERRKKEENGIEACLKPCPFCGKKPNTRLVVVTGVAADRISVEVGCHPCGIYHKETIGSHEGFDKLEKAKDAVIKKWNGRT